MDAPRQLQIEVREEPRAVIIALQGELDLASAPCVQARLETAASSDAELVIVDVRGVTFMDSTGLNVLVMAHQASDRSNQRFAIVKGSPQADRLFSLTGTDALFVLADSPERLM
jgi:anti-anti-sigma factor